MRCRERIASAARRPSGDHVQFIGQPSSAWRRASASAAVCHAPHVVQGTQTVVGVLLVAAGACPDNAHSARSCAPPALPLLAHEERTRTSTEEPCQRANPAQFAHFGIRRFTHSACTHSTHARVRCRWAAVRSNHVLLRKTASQAVMRRDRPLYSYWLPPCTRARALPHWSPRHSSSPPSEGR
jgi:hypothetical protein